MLFLGKVKFRIIHPAHVKITGLLEPQYGPELWQCCQILPEIFVFASLVDLGGNSVENRAVIFSRKILFRLAELGQKLQGV